ncbi:hypothetical protein D3C72_1222650 [compost metagenome]
MIPALSTRKSNLPFFSAVTASPTFIVTVPIFGFGIKPRGPRILATLETVAIISGVAIHLSKSNQPPWILATRSSAPTKSAPAFFASASFGPFAKTTTFTSLPRPCGRAIAPRTCWSDCLGSIPKRIATSIDSSNFAGAEATTSLNASSTEYFFVESTFLEAASNFLPAIHHP